MHFGANAVLLACNINDLFFRITDTLLPFDLLSILILILDKLCMHLICLYRCFFSFSFNILYLF